LSKNTTIHLPYYHILPFGPIAAEPLIDGAWKRGTADETLMKR
jgi:hypothetical protein